MLSVGAGATALVHDGGAVDFPPSNKWAVPIASTSCRSTTGSSKTAIRRKRSSSRGKPQDLEIPDLAVSATCVRCRSIQVIRCR